jgi:hypothetical protein
MYLKNGKTVYINVMELLSKARMQPDEIVVVERRKRPASIGDKGA